MAIDINNASLEELAVVPGLDMELAAEIIAYREENGSFDSLDELADLSGFDEEMVMRLREAGANVGATAETEGSSDF